jgi:glycosyltransferase involved in cell wall biosynthesis
MRILYVRDGINAHDHRFLRAAVAQGHEPIVVELTETGTGPLPADLPLEHYAASAAALPSIVADKAVDVAHVGPIPTVGWRVAASLPPELPLVLVSWGSDILRDCDDDAVRGRALEALDRADVILVDCDAVRRTIRDWRPLMATPFVSFPWGIELSRFAEPDTSAAAQLRTELGWTDHTVFTSTRSWEPGYGIEVLLAAFALIAERDAEARLLLLGDGTLHARVGAEIGRLGLGERIRTPGRIAESRLPVWYGASDLYVSSSPCDGTSVSLLEAMASGLPAIVHERFGNIEWIRPSQNGWLADCQNAASLAAAMSEAAQARRQWAGMGRQNRARVFADADWAKNSLRLTDAYRLAVHGA